MSRVIECQQPFLVAGYVNCGGGVGLHSLGQLHGELGPAFSGGLVQGPRWYPLSPSPTRSFAQCTQKPAIILVTLIVQIRIKTQPSETVGHI